MRHTVTTGLFLLHRGQWTITDGRPSPPVGGRGQGTQGHPDPPLTLTPLSCCSFVPLFFSTSFSRPPAAAEPTLNVLCERLRVDLSVTMTMCVCLCPAWTAYLLLPLGRAVGRDGAGPGLERHPHATVVVLSVTMQHRRCVLSRPSQCSLRTVSQSEFGFGDSRCHPEPHMQCLWL